MQALKLLGGILRTNWLDRDVPIAVTMALTYRCNLRCRYCQIWKAAGSELSTIQVMAAISELSEAGMCRLGLTGGEPLLRPDIGEIVDHARSLDLFTTVFTNGMLVPANMPTLHKLDAVLISLDGPREKHDAMRGRGAFDAAFRAIQLLSAEGIKVWTNTVVTNRNIEVVDFVIDLAARYGAHAAFQPVFEHSYSVKGDRVAELRAGQVQYEAMIDHLLRRKREGAPVLNSPKSLQILRRPDWEENPRKCLAASSYGAVSPEGRVAPCPILLQREGWPNGTRVGFAEAFRRTAKPVPCKGCYCFATLENDLLLSMEPQSLGNTADYMIREQWRRLKQRLVPGSTPRTPADESYHAAMMDYPQCQPVECAAGEEQEAGTATGEESEEGNAMSRAEAPAEPTKLKEKRA